MSKPSTVSEYIATLPRAQGRAVNALAARISARLDNCDTCISYAMPAWRLKGTSGSKSVVIGVSAFANNLGVYPFSGSVVPQIAERLVAEGFKHSKSGVLFAPDRHLPDWILDQMIRLRLAEIG